MTVLLNKRPKRQLRRRIVFIVTIQFDLTNKEITLAHGLTSVQKKQEINVTELVKQLKLTS